jgi:hypothetical protein
MSREAQLIQDRYDALMFAKTPESAREAARGLARLVLGEGSDGFPLDEAMRRCCRILRPSADPREQERFEAEFVELALPVANSHRAAA